MKEVVIVGAGPSGALLSCLLQKRGYSVTVHDMRGDPRVEVGLNTTTNRYVGLLLSRKGAAALARAGVGQEDLSRYSAVVRGRSVWNGDGATEFDWGRDEGSRAIDRLALLSDIVERAEKAGVAFHFNSSVLSVDTTTKEIHTASGTFPYDLLVGADGVNSVIRSHCGFTHSEKVLASGYCWAEIPQPDFVDPTRVNVWAHPEGIIHGLPSRKGHLNLTVIAKKETLKEFTADPIKCSKYFATHLPRLVEAAPGMAGDVAGAQKGVFRKVSCRSHISGDVVVIGDAAHAMAPFLGQGMNCSLQDAVVLDECLAGDDITKALTEYNRLRLPEADACQALVEVQQHYFFSLVRSRIIRIRMQLHALLRTFFPFYICPTLREMVNSSDYTYAEALKQQTAQNHLLCLGRVYE